MRMTERPVLAQAQVFTPSPTSPTTDKERRHMNDSTDSAPRSIASIKGHPIHPMLVPFPIAGFVGALICDITYWQTADIMWSNFSAWLITAGLVAGALAAIAGLVDFAGNRAIRAQRPAWPHVIGNVVAMLLSLVNIFVHSRDGWTSVVPTGLVLSSLVVLILLFTGWMGGAMVYRHRVGVTP
jgi:uncharacterized membrane protein